MDNYESEKKKWETPESRAKEEKEREEWENVERKNANQNFFTTMIRSIKIRNISICSGSGGIMVGIVAIVGIIAILAIFYEPKSAPPPIVTKEYWRSIKSGKEEKQSEDIAAEIKFELEHWGVYRIVNFDGFLWQGYNVAFRFTPPLGCKELKFSVVHKALISQGKQTDINVWVNKKLITFPDPPNGKPEKVEIDILRHCNLGKSNTVSYGIKGDILFGLQRFAIKWSK